jgi:ribulose bisphosphate carboxylase small subunit
MNLTVLEKLARQALTQGDVTEKSNEMLSKGFISPAEHRSLTSLSWQIAANVRANGKGEGTVAWAKPMALWW